MLSSRGRFRVTAKLVRQPRRRLVRLSCFTTLAKDSLSSALVSGTFLYKDPDTQVGGEWGAGHLDRSWGEAGHSVRVEAVLRSRPACFCITDAPSQCTPALHTSQSGHQWLQEERLESVDVASLLCGLDGMEDSPFQRQCRE